MKLHLLLILVLAFGLSGDGKKDGRRGNALYDEERYEAAADAYYAGLEAHGEESTDATSYGLQNNLGAALHKQEQFDMAAPAFERALATATVAADVARSAYNAGNNAFLGQNAEAALDYYRRALLADPSNRDAKFNYEFVKRQMQQQQQQQDGESDEQDEQSDENQQQNQGDQQEQGDQQQDQQQQDQQQQQDEPSEGGREDSSEGEDPAADQKETPQGQLSAANQPQDPPQASPQTVQPLETDRMTEEEARKMLQAIRDRDMLRRLRRQAAERSRRIPVERDW